MANVTVTLKRPLKVNETEITSIELREPNLLALRDVPINLLQLGQGSTLSVLLPRISTPTLTDTMLNRLSAADLGKISIAVAGFFTETASESSEEIQS
ncbi:phage tail assembly protein [Wohlfahrtiimonas larvae]|uniref:Phage tail protein n=1 Tax=Wohlfahrtiimonas larvae TaxID=1157986 RepID=A0ABP9MMV5_9GAMM|nr:phage tail assembly protein [Wohlfahrtiimonas larvae]